MTTTYFIDGYNVLHKLQSDQAGWDLELARDRLIDMVADFCSATGEAATIFFDGTGRMPDTTRHGTGQPRIVYSPKKRSADAMIEKAVYEGQRRETIVVVTADRAIRDLCTGMGALAMAPENFFSVAEDARDRLSRTVESRHSKGRASLEDHLEESEKEQLERLRDRLQQPPAGDEPDAKT